MFSNIGGKIQGLASFIAWIGIIISIIVGLLVILGGFSDVDLGGFSLIIGLLIIILGSLSSWISSWVLYGFGELIVRVTEVSTFNRELVALKHRESASASIPRQ